MPALGRRRFDDLGDRPVQQEREQKRRSDRLVRNDTRIRVLQALQQQLLDHAAGVRPEVGIHRRQQPREQAVAPQSLEAACAVTRQEEFERLVEQACGRHASDQITQAANRFRRCRIHLESQFRLEACRAQHPHRVLAVTRLRIADQLQLACGNVFGASHVIPQGKVGDVVIERVGGEIPSPDILIDGPIHVVAKDAAGFIEHAPGGVRVRARTRLGFGGRHGRRCRQLRLELRLVELGGFTVLRIRIG